MDAGSPCPEDGDFFDGRPDAAETEEAINKFISGLESQEQAGFDRLHSLLSRLPVIVVEVLIQCMDWNIASRQSGIPESELPELQQKAIDLLDLLKKNLPDKTREKAKWNFEKAHSILHKVREIVLWGNSDNTSCQAPEVSTNVYVHVCTWYIHIYSFFIHVHTMYIHVFTVYIACCTDF